jgi:uncharacterized membrane protein YgaE (UPF0421/DUF939 family)
MIADAKVRELTRKLQLCLRAALAAGLALWFAELLRLEYPIYAMIAAVIVTDLSPDQSRRLGLQRLAGTIVGAGCGASLAAFAPAGPWTIGLGILVAMLLCQLLRVEAGAKLAGYVCGIVLMSFNVEPWSYALQRLIETVLGGGVAVAVSFVPKLIPTDRSGDA